MKCNTYPLVSIIIATYNSHNVLPRTLKALRNQTYPSESMEILAIDGGSSDDTILIAESFGCTVVDNPDKDPGTAKRIGLEAAKGRYIMTLDHDEVLVNPDSISNRIVALTTHPECKIATVSGYMRPIESPGLNEYISEWGDPFSRFIYRQSIGYRFYEKNIQNRFGNLITENESYGFYRITRPNEMLMELQCFGSILDYEYFKNTVNLLESRYVQSHAFYEMCKRGDNYLLISRNDPLLHYSVDSIRAYLPKLRYRIVNNVHFKDRSDIGFGGREKAAGICPAKKYLFIPYALSIILPLVDSIYYSLTRRNASYLYHTFLCFYVAVHIIIEYIKKYVGSVKKPPTYDGR